MLNDPKIYYKKCKLCGKELISISEQQNNYNYRLHYESCRLKEKAKQEKIQLKQEVKENDTKGD